MIMGDVGNEITYIAKDKDLGTIIDLTGIDYAKVVLSIGNNRIERSTKIDTSVIFGIKTAGEIKYTIQSGDISTSGELQMQVTLYFLDGDILTCDVVRETVQSKL